MSALGDALSTKNKDAVQGSKIEIFVDSLATDTAVTYGVRLEAPEYSQIVLSDLTAQGALDALAEYQAWAAALWAS